MRRSYMLAQVGVVVAGAGAAGQPCVADWSTEFAWGRPNGAVRTLAVLDDGTGPALYAGGFFDRVGDGPASGIVRWDGRRWEQLGGGVDGLVYALAMYDDGTGPALYVGGWFDSAGGVQARDLAKWDGAEWHAVWDTAPFVKSLAVYDDGTGPVLYVGTEYGYGVGFLSWFDGKTFEDAGVNGPVRALATIDGGAGPMLYAGGTFKKARNVAARNIARWDGTSWSALGTGTNEAVRAIAGADLGDGPRVYAGGDFTSAGGVSVSFIAAWDGAGWSALGSGLWGGNLNATNVNAMSLVHNGQGASLYVAGDFDTAGETVSRNIARWDGVAWSGLENGVSGQEPDWVGALAVFGVDAEPAVWVGGQFDRASDVYMPYLTRWEGGEWRDPPRLGTNDEPVAFAGFDDGTGQALYATGWFDEAGELKVFGGARYNGESWDPEFPGFPGGATTLEVFDDGGGAALYAGGAKGGVSRWDGHTWQTVGNGVSPTVLDLLAFHGPAGPLLYAGGSFSLAGGEPASRIAAWDGEEWLPLGNGLDSVVKTMKVWDDGSGPALYAGGLFKAAGGQPANYIARWDGKSWSPLAGGLNNWVLALEVFDDDGGGTDLYAAGPFTKADGVAAQGIARWDGAAWSSVGTGLPSKGVALSVFDDGTGAALYAVWPTGFGEESLSHLAKWDGANWTTVGSHLSYIYTMASLTDADGPALYLGGNFESVDGVSSLRIARYGCLDTQACLPDLDGSGSLDLFDFLTFVNMFNAQDPKADIDGNGAVDLFDFLGFVNLFNQGC
jgi:hypothetical protein